MAIRRRCPYVPEHVSVTSYGEKVSAKMFRIVFVLAGAMAAMSLGWAPAEAGGYKAKRLHADRVERDCTPINGRYGYYGNPWCDTGSSRPPDIEFRQRRAAQYRYWRAGR